MGGDQIEKKKIIKGILFKLKKVMPLEAHLATFFHSSLLLFTYDWRSHISANREIKMARSQCRKAHASMSLWAPSQSQWVGCAFYTFGVCLYDLPRKYPKYTCPIPCPYFRSKQKSKLKKAQTGCPFPYPGPTSNTDVMLLLPIKSYKLKLVKRGGYMYSPVAFDFVSDKQF